MSKNLLKVTINSVPDFVKLAWKSKNNLLLVSDPGTGKSTIINGMADENTKVTTFTGSSTYEESINGIPFKDENGIQRYTQPEWLKDMIEWAEEHPEGMNIVFLDEFNTADKIVMDTFKTILTERRVPTQPTDKNLPENTVIVAAMNPQSQNAGSDFDRAHASRFMVLEISSGIEDYRRYIAGKSKAVEIKLLEQKREVSKEQKLGILDQISAQDWAQFEEGDYQEINSRSLSKFFDAYGWLDNIERDVPILSQAFFGMSFTPIEVEIKKKEIRQEKVRKMQVYPTRAEIEKMTDEEIDEYEKRLSEQHSAAALNCKALFAAVKIERKNNKEGE